MSEQTVPPLGGWSLIPTSMLPMKLLWLGEDVGPKPDDQTHILVSAGLGASSGPAAFVSPELVERLKRDARRSDQ